MNTDRNSAGVAEAARARAELYETLGQLRERLDYAQRIDDATARASERVERLRRDRPLMFMAGVAGAALVAGVVVWGVARVVVRNLKN